MAKGQNRHFEPLFELSRIRNAPLEEAFADLLNECETYTEAAERLGTNLTTLKQWRVRFLETQHVPKYEKKNARN